MSLFARHIEPEEVWERDTVIEEIITSVREKYPTAVILKDSEVCDLLIVNPVSREIRTTKGYLGYEKVEPKLLTDVFAIHVRAPNEEFTEAEQVKCGSSACLNHTLVCDVKAVLKRLEQGL